MDNWFCIWILEEVEKKSKSIKEAEKAGVHVVDEDFLDKVQKGGAALLITQHSIASWGSDVRKRLFLKVSKVENKISSIEK